MKLCDALSRSWKGFETGAGRAEAANTEGRTEAALGFVLSLVFLGDEFSCTVSQKAPADSYKPTFHDKMGLFSIVDHTNLSPYDNFLLSIGFDSMFLYERRMSSSTSWHLFT